MCKREKKRKRKRERERVCSGFGNPEGVSTLLTC